VEEEEEEDDGEDEGSDEEEEDERQEESGWKDDEMEQLEKEYMDLHHQEQELWVSIWYVFSLCCICHFNLFQFLSESGKTDNVVWEWVFGHKESTQEKNKLSVD